MSNFVQTIINDLPGNISKAFDFLTADHSTKQELSISTIIDKKVETIKFSVQPQNNIAFENTSNIAVFNQAGGLPAIQSVGPNKSMMSWQGVFYNTGRATSYEQKEKDKYQYDIVKKLELWQNQGRTVTVTFGPIVVDALIQTFNYAVKRIELIQYSISLIIDENAYLARGGKRRIDAEKFWANGSINTADLLGGEDSWLNKAYTGISEGVDKFRTMNDTITQKTTNVFNNLERIEKSYSDLILVPANECVDMIKQLDDEVELIQDSIDTIGGYAPFRSFETKLKGLF